MAVFIILTYLLREYCNLNRDIAKSSHLLFYLQGRMIWVEKWSVRWRKCATAPLCLCACVYLCAPVCKCVSVCSCVQVCLRRLTPLPRLMSTSAKECAATEGGQILVLRCNEGDFWMDHLPRLLGLLGWHFCHPHSTSIIQKRENFRWVKSSQRCVKSYHCFSGINDCMA